MQTTLSTLLQKRTSGYDAEAKGENAARLPRRIPRKASPAMAIDRPALHLLGWLAPPPRHQVRIWAASEGFLQLLHKIWNAANFNTENTDGQDTVTAMVELVPRPDQLIISQLQRTGRVTASLTPASTPAAQASRPGTVPRT